MVHGFGGTGMVFYRIIGVLRKYFRITTIDLLGQGASGRPNFNSKTGKDSI
jgi:pimeloyl-ACP methyl ester carboxylesterase